MKLKIIGCSDSMYWYNDIIGAEFEIYRMGEVYAWVREPDEFQLLNFVLIQDFEIVEEEEKE